MTQAVLLLLAAAVLWSPGRSAHQMGLSARANCGRVPERHSPAGPAPLFRQAGRQFFGHPTDRRGLLCGHGHPFVSATKLTTSGNAILLQYTAPLYVALLSGWLLHERDKVV